MAYAAKNRDDLLSAINSFLDDSVVLAPGDWDRHLLLPLLEAEVAIKKRHRKMLLREKGMWFFTILVFYFFSYIHKGHIYLKTDFQSYDIYYIALKHDFFYPIN